MKKYVGLKMVVFMFVMVSNAFAAPQKINFQGKLTDAAGNPITASVSMIFSIYDIAINGTALWTETQNVTITNGVYNVLLGQVNPIDTELTETKALWLGVKVGADAEMSPRVELTPGLYDLIILNTIAMQNGRVGIGITTPGARVHIRESVSGQTPTNVNGLFVENNGNDNDYYVFQTATVGGGKSFTITNTGNVGIGTIHPQYKLDIVGMLHATGQDFAEPFDMVDIASLELGDVVVIDPLNPLHVTKSSAAYDTTVAGIISSTTQAGYVAGSRSDGSSNKPIALVGRVLCNVSTENGAIEIGDLLTTSNTPGYAMKATDIPKAHGAIMGKALQAFDDDKGQIMVLVTLQ